MEISFCELRSKSVVNVFNGRNLGNVIDLIFDTCCARILGIVVPNQRTGFQLFRCNSDIFIPYNRIVKIGKDVILVELTPCNTPASILSEKESKKEGKNKNTKNESSHTTFDKYCYPNQFEKFKYQEELNDDNYDN